MLEFSSKLLKDEFIRRQRGNPRYSLRAFALDMGLSAPVVSQVFKEQIRIPKNKAEAVADKLNLTPTLRQKFIQSIHRPRRSGSLKTLKKRLETTEDNHHLLSEERDFKIIAEWEHYALFSLMDTVDFRADIEWISKRLSISTIRARDVVQRLIEADLIIWNENGQLIKKVDVITTTKEIPSAALRMAHLDELKLAAQAQENVPTGERHITSLSMAISKDDLEEVKLYHQEFINKLLEIEKRTRQEEVYQFCFQAFPLTHKVPDKIKHCSKNEDKGERSESYQ